MIRARDSAAGDLMSVAGERSRYLSLALDARRAINAIRAVEKNRGDISELRNSIAAATASLNVVSQRADLYAHLGPNEWTPYRQYEELQTVVETSSSFDAHALIPSLLSLLNSNVPAENDLQVARRFFRALEGRALHHYNDPMPSQGLIS
jgi:hypothetical protein